MRIWFDNYMIIKKKIKTKKKKIKKKQKKKQKKKDVGGWWGW